jgi:release factor H-coupled RctB family protein
MDPYVVTGEGVGIDPEAVDQLARLARDPDCVRAVGLPDLHPGPGIPIGAAVASRRLQPALVGSDAGCGVRLAIVDKLKVQGDALERRLLAATDEAPLPGVDLEAALIRIWRDGPRGLCAVDGVPEDLAELAAREPEDPPNLAPVPPELLPSAAALGSIGGGNHFAELSRVDRVDDRANAARLGIGRTSFAILVHSGSRGLGKLLADRWLGREPDARYLGELEGAVRFARANRLVLQWVLASAAGVGRADRVVGGLDLVHNTVVARDLDGPAWVHRKGAAPAEAGALTVVLGSRGTPSWILCGCGSAATLCCVAHGAGRRIPRAEAKSRLRARYQRAELRRTALGGRVLCDDADLLWEEHPDCYKAVDPVIDALVAHGAATRVASLHPLATVKR